jgi:phosphoglycolate phosphatase
MLVVFDLDGTLIDSVRDLAASASELVTSRGGRPLDLEEVATMVGDGAAQLVRRALARAGLSPDTPDALPQFLDIYARRLMDTTTAYDGVVPLLAQLSRRARLAVLTNKPLQPSLRILDALQLRTYFEDVRGGDGPHARKPDPEGLLSLGRDGWPTLLVGDSPIDATTAQAAGCAFAWARYGFGAARFSEPPDTPYVLERPVDLIAAFDRFAAVVTGR